jgi:hypothetical protein
MAGRQLGSRLVWFVLLWLGGVLAVTAVGLIIRAFLMPG